MEDDSKGLETNNERRPTTPDSLMTNSLYRATATVDELTATLAKVSRAPSPVATDSLSLTCCCGNPECPNLQAWTTLQGKLENRVILCAEVGQALLEKHEAYVRRHGGEDMSDTQSDISRPETPTIHASNPQASLLSELHGRVQDLEKRLHDALLNVEITERAKKSLLEELEDARGTLSKLSVAQAKSVGWETRLDSAEQEREDIKQELQGERQRLRAAEMQVNALKDRCEKLHLETSRLYDELDKQRRTRTELSDEILRDARARLEMVQQQRFGHNIFSESPEVTEVMESLVADNEALKRDVAELQNYLTDSREEIRMLREEAEEYKASSTATIARTSSSNNRHNHAHSWASSFGRAPLSPPLRSRSVSRQSYEPLTPNTQARPLSPDSQSTSEQKPPPISSPRPKYPPSHLNLEADDRSRTSTPDLGGSKSPRRPLFLLSQSRGVQTDELNWSSFFGPVFRSRLDDGSSSATPPPEGQSESSSLADSHTQSTITGLIDKASRLFTRMSQADALTLTNRLKRQRLAGDVSHLSHATITAILSEVNGIRSHFRGLLEDENVVSACTRRDLRSLLNLIREIFVELGQMRMALNDVILDPSLAPRLREVAMDPTKGLDAIGQISRSGGSGNSGWMAPLSKFFGGVVASHQSPDAKEIDRGMTETSRKASSPPVNDGVARPKPAKFVPKSGPALAASATTVNVEFTGSGIGRSTINVKNNNTPSAAATSGGAPGSDLTERSRTPRPVQSSRAVMNIFAGAPVASASGDDPWVILPTSSTTPRAPRKHQSTMNMRTATLTRAAGRWAASANTSSTSASGSTADSVDRRLPRNVDAVIDADSNTAVLDENDDETDIPNLLERTLRPRGLSDSSIRTTFLEDEAAAGAPPSVSIATEGSSMSSPQGAKAPVNTPVSPLPRQKRNSIRMSGPPSTYVAPGRQGAYPGGVMKPGGTWAGGSTRTSVFQAFSRAFTMPSFAASGGVAAKSQPKPPSTLTLNEDDQTNAQPEPRSNDNSIPTNTSLARPAPTSTTSTTSTATKKILPSLAHWAGLDAAETAEFVGSVQREHGFEDDIGDGMTPVRSRGMGFGWRMERDLPGREM